MDDKKNKMLKKVKKGLVFFFVIVFCVTAACILSDIICDTLNKEKVIVYVISLLLGVFSLIGANSIDKI